MAGWIHGDGHMGAGLLLVGEDVLGPGLGEESMSGPD